jgi:hypothetical protein
MYMNLAGEFKRNAGFRPCASRQYLCKNLHISFVRFEVFTAVTEELCLLRRYAV